MVVLSHGLEVAPDMAELCKSIGVELRESQFVKTSSFSPGGHQPLGHLRLRGAGRAQGHPPVGDGGLGRGLRGGR